MRAYDIVVRAKLDFGPVAVHLVALDNYHLDVHGWRQIALNCQRRNDDVALRARTARSRLEVSATSMRASLRTSRE